MLIKVWSERTKWAWYYTLTKLVNLYQKIHYLAKKYKKQTRQCRFNVLLLSPHNKKQSKETALVNPQNLIGFKCYWYKPSRNTLYYNRNDQFWRIFGLSKYVMEILMETISFWRAYCERRSRKIFWQFTMHFDGTRQKGMENFDGVQDVLMG